MLELSTTEENYLKAIYFLNRPAGNQVSTNAIAERLQTKAATVTDMLRKLHEKKLINYTPYRGSQLTELGVDLAKKIVRKHRLWETFLVEKLDFSWDEVHEIAEQLEHIRSVKLTDRLEVFLGHPNYDPHGDPIPNKNGEVPLRENITLDQMKQGSTVVVSGVKDTSSDFLKYVARLGINLGDTLHISAIESFDGTLTIEHDSGTHQLSALAASNIYVKNKA